jgi:tetratricopeptide (TPR) repeat protein
MITWTSGRRIGMTKPFDQKLRALYRHRSVLYEEERFADFENDLLNLLEISESAEDRFDVLSSLADHYHFIEDDSRARDAIQQCVALCPERVEGWLGLAEHFHYYELDLDEAARNIEIALQKAWTEQCQVKQVLGVRIRIGLAREMYEVVNDSLELLVAYQLPRGSVDVPFEHDFVPMILIDKVDGIVLQQYKSLVGL